MAIRRFAVVVDGDVAGTISVDDESPNDAAQRHIAAFDSDPKIVPIFGEEPVDFGWTYDGETFTPPVE